MIRFLCLSLLFPLIARSLFADDTSYAANLVTEGWQHRVWGIYPIEKVKQDEELPPTPKADSIELTAARGEREPFILLLRANVPLREVSIVAGDLRHADGTIIPAKQLVPQRLGYVSVDEPSGTRMKQTMPYPVGTGWFPDPLLENRGDVRPKHNLQFLITVQIPRDARAGRHEGSVRLRFRKETWMPADFIAEDVVRVIVNVRSFAMPEHSPLLNTSFANLRELPDSQRTPDAIAAMQRNFTEHRQTPEPSLPSPRIKVDAQGALTVDSTAWEQAVDTMFKNGGTHLFVPVWGFHPEPALAQGLYFLHHFPAVTGQKWMGVSICAADKTLTPEFQRLFGVYLKHMHTVLKQHGWLDRAFIATMDEPYTYHTGDRANDIPTNNYEVIRNYVRLVREIAPGLRTFCTADPAEGLIGHIDHWCLRNLDHATAARERAEKHGEVVTFCDNYRTFIDYPAISARSLGWLAWSIGARGWLTYETLGNYRTAWEAPVLTYAQFSGATVWGMGQMFYPAPLTGAPLNSLRWELMREGCDDYEYLWLLREMLKSKPNAEAQRLLDTAAPSVVTGGGDAETMARTNTVNATSNLVPHRFRAQIGDRLEKLRASAE